MDELSLTTWRSRDTDPGGNIPMCVSLETNSTANVATSIGKNKVLDHNLEDSEPRTIFHE